MCQMRMGRKRGNTSSEEGEEKWVRRRESRQGEISSAVVHT